MCWTLVEKPAHSICIQTKCQVRLTPITEHSCSLSLLLQKVKMSLGSTKVDPVKKKKKNVDFYVTH